MRHRTLTHHLKAGIFRGLGFGIGLSAAGLFAAAAAMNVFSAGQTISASQINQNFIIAAPEGAVVAFNLGACPEGWAPADGTNGTPNLQGMFVRGRDVPGTTDPDGTRALAASQQDAFQGHIHQISVATNPSFVGTYAGKSDNTNGDGSLLTTTSPSTDGTNGTPRIANETRPKNVALTYCMRKNS